MKSPRVALAVALAISTLLPGCEQPAALPADQVAAKVGDATISEFELSRAVARLGPMSAADAADARGKVLQALVDQHLVSNAAKNAKLDTLPDVALAMQQAQRQVLVEAYMERLFKDLPKPSDSAIQDYYNQHPELFAQRKLYRVHELELQRAAAQIPEIEAQLKQSHSLAEFTDWLGTRGIAVKSGEAVRAAENIPATMLAQLVKMKEGQAVVVPVDENRISVLQLLGSQVQPISLEQARDTIARVILAGQRKNLLETEIHKLRGSGKIEYASGFAPAPPAAGTLPGKP